jgi:hypothetical protein
MCKALGLVLTVLINVPLVGLILGLQDGSWELKTFAIPFAVSPVAAIVLYCGRPGSFLTNVALVLLLLSLAAKGVGAGFAGYALGAASNSNSVLGNLGAIVYGMVMVVFLVSGASDLYLFCTQVNRTPKPSGSRELVSPNEFF